MREVKIKKKNGLIVDFDENKIITAVDKSADRALVKFTQEDHDNIINYVKTYINENNLSIIDVPTMHIIVENALSSVNKLVADKYIIFRNYKLIGKKMLEEIFKTYKDVMFIGDKSNANTDSALVTTKRNLIGSEATKQLYREFFLNEEERLASDEGFIYIHDQSQRLFSHNCCLFDVEAVLNDGFTMGVMEYTEPKDILTACAVLGDIILMSASHQYGKLLLP